MVIAVVEAQGKYFRWNLSAAVGTGQPNLLDDVELVRFGYICWKQNVKYAADPELQTLLNELRPMGVFDDDLARVIVMHQRIRGGTQDGKVSPANISFTSHNRERYDGTNTWMIIALDNNMRDMTDDYYPRIDKHLQSGPALSLVVKGILTGSKF